MSTHFIPIILGTNRGSRMSERVATFLQQKVGERADTQLIDVRDLLPEPQAYGPQLKEKHAAYQEAIQRADGIIIVTPEYNHAAPGVLKHALDILYDEFAYTPVGFVGVSGGGFGGARAIEALLPVTRALGLLTIRTDMNISHVQDAFTEDGTPTQDVYHQQFDSFFSELTTLIEKLQ